MRKKITCAFLMLSMCACLAACGGKDDDKDDNKGTTNATVTEEETTTEAQASGSVQNSGAWSVEVPADWTFKVGDFLDENDTRYFSVNKSSFSGFSFSADSEDSIKNNYDYNKKTYTNEQTDFKTTFGSAEWEGFQYSDGFGGYGFEAFATVDGKMIRVASTGFKYDSDEAKAVLGSLKYDASKDTGNASSEEKTDEVTENKTEAASSSEAETTEATSEGASTEADSSEAATSEEASSEEKTTEAATEEAVSYAKTIEMTGAKIGIPEGYTEMKDAAPSQYVMRNDATGGVVSYISMMGVTDEVVDSIMSGLEVEKKEYEINGIKWVGADSDGFYTFATATGDKALVISINYGATMEEMETLIKGVELSE